MATRREKGGAVPQRDGNQGKERPFRMRGPTPVKLQAPMSRSPMSALDEALGAGERSIAAFLENANALTQEIASTFPPMSLDEVHAKFAAMPKPNPEESKGGLNSEVVKLCSKVRQHAAAAVEEFRSAELWLSLKAPSVSDGNNFGVEVQNFVNAE